MTQIQFCQIVSEYVTYFVVTSMGNVVDNGKLHLKKKSPSLW